MDAESASLKDFVSRLPSQRGKSEFVYFVQAEGNGRIKIGIARDMTLRLSALQTGSPVRLTLLGILRVDNPDVAEKRLHHIFRAHRTHGEWFEPHPKLVALIQRNAISVEEDRRRVVEAIGRRLEPSREAAQVAEPGKGRKARMARYLAVRGLSA